MTNKTEKHVGPAGGYKTRSGICQLLKSGSKFVVEREGKPPLKALFRFCRRDDLDEIVALQKRVYDHVQDKNTFVMTTEEGLAESIDFDVCIGAYHCGVLIAFTLMVVYPYSSRNLGLYLDYTPQQCAKCATYDTTFVDPDYSGYGLQRAFIRLKDRIAGEMGREEVLATVSPDNARSLQNLESSGFTVAGRKKMYGDFDRLILKKGLKIRKDL